MAVRAILKMGDPRLLCQSAELDFDQVESLEALLIDMWDTMKAEEGAGLAAPQIGVMQRLVIFGYETNSRYPEAPSVPETVLINPQITPLNEIIEEDWEGCLSVPGMRGMVPRYREIRYSGYDQHGNRIEREVSGFHARVVQHECDHLDGILYPLRITDMRQFGFIDALNGHEPLETLASEPPA